MALELKDITEALSENAELLTGVTSHILESDKGKEVIQNKANVLFNEKISEHVSGIYKKDDEQIFEILGVKPKVLEDGSKQKTNELKQELFKELAELRKQKDSLSKDEKVKALEQQIEELKKNGGGAHWEKTFNTESEKWKKEREALIQRAEKAENGVTDFRKQVDIEAGLRGLKFNEDVPEAARKALVNMTVANLVKNSKVEGDAVVYLDDKGAQISNSEYKPESAANILKVALKDILVSEDNNGGGGAPATVTGSIETKNVEGKDVKTLVLPEGAFKTKTEFLKVAEEALLKSGVKRTDADWDKLKNEAYNRYKVAEMPR